MTHRRTVKQVHSMRTNLHFPYELLGNEENVPAGNY